MTTGNLVLATIGIVAFVLYLLRRRARLGQED
jgi:hypothetical protein